jgi:hypothetical protein
MRWAMSDISSRSFAVTFVPGPSGTSPHDGGR